MATIEANSPAFAALVDEAAPVEQICTGFEFVEGPIWNPKQQCLYFSDIPGGIRYCWSPGAGNLYICEHNTSMLIRESPGGERRSMASHWRGTQLNSANDVVVRSDNSIYFSDPTYGRLAAVGIERAQDLTFQDCSACHPTASFISKPTTSASPTASAFRPTRSCSVSTTQPAPTYASSMSPRTDRSATAGSSPKTSATANFSMA